MRNSSQNAGCMRRSPASHCCQVRQVVCTSTPAAVCDSPAASRAARTSAGSGFCARLPAWLRFGWLGNFPLIAAGGKSGNSCIYFGLWASPLLFQEFIMGGNENINTWIPRHGNQRGQCSAGANDLEGIRHFGLQPLLPRGAVEKQCASHELNYTRNARKRKNYFEIFSLGLGDQSNPSNG